ncbi:hypothetical protein TVAG_127990 [Trichomonas vaginalis G3]|uniref:Uncharacterized protein n=1 Tax=Trichomonas vaginalis (strain ATCC PRA-98 / G3) TaxID=412133 RepID=A2EBG0_TRIV3|nr:hypothetical protein TVAGG3_0406700 [Trichomonas vaginalis G3]EAY09990.1 hypothetical protein TVAG_127990 [Trichomonas vaginalis G3]KAI5535070.1 hypothetical protein TVAGG3_0406700 [Trichomonas vaginalis G3]|eukprot:XP_001322213.1 hypothetical protein [Trichomonas vaginalis G3]
MNIQDRFIIFNRNIKRSPKPIYRVIKAILKFIDYFGGFYTNIITSFFIFLYCLFSKIFRRQDFKHSKLEVKTFHKAVLHFVGNYTAKFIVPLFKKCRIQPEAAYYVLYWIDMVLSTFTTYHLFSSIYSVIKMAIENNVFSLTRESFVKLIDFSSKVNQARKESDSLKEFTKNMKDMKGVKGPKELQKGIKSAAKGNKIYKKSVAKLLEEFDNIQESFNEIMQIIRTDIRMDPLKSHISIIFESLGKCSKQIYTIIASAHTSFVIVTSKLWKFVLANVKPEMPKAMSKIWKKMYIRVIRNINSDVMKDYAVDQAQDFIWAVFPKTADLSPMQVWSIIVMSHRRKYGLRTHKCPHCDKFVPNEFSDCQQYRDWLKANNYKDINFE